MEGWTQKNYSDFPALGLIGSRAMRKPGVPPGRTVSRLIEYNKSTFSAYFVFATWGTYLDALRPRSDARSPAKNRITKNVRLLEGYNPTLKWAARWSWLEGYVLRPGKLGGIVEMAELLELSAPKADQVRTLIFLTDPSDLEEAYPEDRALIRGAIRNNVTLLPTYRSAELWAAYESERATTSAGRSADAKVSKSDPKQEALALIAHDGKKLEMCRWVVAHRDKIRQFDKIITTGTTGDWIGQFLLAVGIPQRRIELIGRKASGPKGGDVEIAGAVLRGCCHHVVFFVDPMTSHPHEADIQTLLRTCTMPDVNVNLRLTEQAATSWIGTV